MKYFKYLLAFVITLAITASSFINPIPVKAAGTLTLGTSIGVIGQTITVSGAGFDPGTPANRYVNVIFGRNPGNTLNYTSGYYTIVQQVPLNANGTFSSAFVVPTHLDGGVLETVVTGNYYLFITYHVPPSTNTNTVEVAVPFRVLGGDLNISPSSGPAGTEVNLSGFGFSSQEELTIRYDETEVLTVTQGGNANINGSITNTKVFIPSSPAGLHSVTVTGKTSGAMIGNMFTIEPKLLIRPEVGTASSKIDLYGTGFAANSNVQVTLNAVPIHAGTTDSLGAFKATFPPGTFSEGSFTIACTDAASNTDQISYEIFDASVTLDPSSGSSAWEVAISGAGFQTNEDITISFEGITSSGNVKTKSNANGDFNTVFSAPWETMGEYDVKVTDGLNEKTVTFVIDTSSNIYPLTNLSNPGYVGTQISIAGANFIAGRTVTVTFSGTKVAEGKVGSNGIFNDIIFPAPSTTGGTHIIEATDGTNVLKYRFYMESDAPPKTQLLLPETATKAKAETYFDWEDVTDESGVTYTLRVFTDQANPDGSLVMEKKGLTLSEYTVSETEKLNAITEDTPYYWQVRAVDKAMNEGDWSDARTMFVGFGFSLPQGIIYALIVGIALLLSVFTFWLGRKTAYY